MNGPADILFPLLRNGLYPERPVERIPELTVSAWKEVITLSRKHTVLGILYQGVSRLGEAYPLPPEILFSLVEGANRIEEESRRKEQIAWTEFQRLKAEGYHPRVLKGPAVARFYPNPFLRQSGDIDLWLPQEELTRLLASLGEEPLQLADGSIHYQRGGVDFDLHVHYFDLHLPPERLPEVPSPYATLLMLSAHILKHASGPGIGLRQFCDMALASEKLSCDPALLLETYRKAGLERWTRLLYSWLETYLGVQDPFARALKSVSPAPLERIIMQGGNFGHYDPSRRRALSAGAVRRKADTAFRYLRRLPFSLHYAPRETFCYLGDLVRGNVS